MAAVGIVFTLLLLQMDYAAGFCETLEADIRNTSSEKSFLEGTYEWMPGKDCHARRVYQRQANGSTFYIYYGKVLKTQVLEWVLTEDPCTEKEEEISVYARYMSWSNEPAGTWDSFHNGTWNGVKIYLTCTTDNSTWRWYLISFGAVSALVILGGIVISCRRHFTKKNKP